MGKRKFIQRSKKSSGRDDHKPFIPVQAKMLINQPNDTHEAEADKMADTVVSNAHSGETTRSVLPHASSITPAKLQRAGNEEDAMPVQSKEQQVASATATQITGAKSAGTPLGDDTRNEMETGFGADFSKVKVHTGTDAERMSEGLNAQAFTHENHIFFNKGKYNPKSKEGKHLLAHELTHTIQQRKNGNQIHRKKQVKAACKSCGKETSKKNAPNQYGKLLKSIRLLKGASIQGSPLSVYSDLSMIDNKVRSLRFLLKGIDDLKLSEDNDAKIKKNLVKLSGNVKLASAIGIGGYSALIKKMSTLSFAGVSSIPIIVELLAIIIEVIAAILSVPFLILMAIIAVIVLIIVYIEEIVKFIIHAVEQALVLAECTARYVFCKHHSPKPNECHACFRYCIAQNGALKPGC